MIQTDELPVVGILRGIRDKDIDPLTELFIQQGIRHIEITMNTEGAEQLIGRMQNQGRGQLNVGAGTVLNEKDLDRAMNAGAKFIVSPSVVPGVIGSCVNQKIPVFPGALTPTEVHMAWDLGATMVKLFPASLFGPGYIRAIKGPLDQIRIMAVGGVSTANVQTFFHHGADAVAFGAGLIRPNLLAEEKYTEIGTLLAGFIAAIQDNHNLIA